MKYNIHVGDYVETKEICPKIGYVNHITARDEWIELYITNTNYDTIGHFFGKEDELNKNFIRIGQYDFTEKDKIKSIDKLDIKLKYKEVIADKITMHTDGTMELEHGSKEKIIDGIEDIDNVTLYSKINEIIDRLNSLNK